MSAMQWVEWFEIAFASARLLMFLAAPIFFGMSISAWIHGDKAKAIYLAASAAFLRPV